MTGLAIVSEKALDRTRDSGPFSVVVAGGPPANAEGVKTCAAGSAYPRFRPADELSVHRPAQVPDAFGVGGRGRPPLLQIGIRRGMNSRSGQTNVQLQLQLTGWVAFSATLEVPTGPLWRSMGRPSGRVCIRRCDDGGRAQMSKTEKSRNELRNYL